MFDYANKCIACVSTVCMLCSMCCAVVVWGNAEFRRRIDEAEARAAANSLAAEAKREAEAKRAAAERKRGVMPKRAPSTPPQRKTVAASPPGPPPPAKSGKRRSDSKDAEGDLAERAADRIKAGAEARAARAAAEAGTRSSPRRPIANSSRQSDVQGEGTSRPKRKHFKPTDRYTPYEQLVASNKKQRRS